MWLLSTNRAELHYFARHFDADGGYAILSHTWDGDEQSLQEVRAIEVRCRANGTNPRDDPELSPKICECCILAERHGYHWVWIDSCCIDKTSSSELSEAINSMYEWYRASEICYAYLKDVPSDDVVKARDSAFRESRWHSRGWTLQELIAPHSVIFLSVDWCELGNRGDLAELLKEITRIPVGIFTGEDRPAEYGASNRMSWASRRRTTRIEDEAYCLMGLFGVSMPTNYGEGKKAFIRLQNEIMKQDLDMSLFAFGECVDQDEIIQNGIAFDASDGGLDLGNSWRYLLADSPRSFGSTFGYIPSLGQNAKHPYPPLDSTTSGPFDGVELPRATTASYGIKLRLPVATVDGITIAAMLCEGSDRHFGLFLTRDPSGKDPMRPRYFTGQSYSQSTTGSASFLARMCDLGDDLYKLTFNGKPVEASWRTIYIVPTAAHFYSEQVTSPSLALNYNLDSKFHVPLWLTYRFTALQFVVNEVKSTDTTQVLKFVNHSEGRIFVSLGTCTKGQDPDKPPLLWAKVVVMTLVNPSRFTHDCSTDHLDTDSWATRSKVFGDADRSVRLSFMSSMQPPRERLVIHLELFGRVFEEMLRESGISFPSVADLQRPTPRTAAYDATISESQPHTLPQH
ncbi:hypothetical protein GSI_12055 [Ganoderma sinense ZZ0214-1]|uniref:Uncharacterized protein n=1 Tax=Ganoderma sinense ZZ0214-1 TaxID=1077348 RepID=A0A2G8RXQ1_9APHY|nr:hypothetical protein GSI_12055 [Ganoderma sinense ZZ0214-1]